GGHSGARAYKKPPGPTALMDPAAIAPMHIQWEGALHADIHQLSGTMSKRMLSAQTLASRTIT
ncbi:hypothetical protein R6G99_09345, partial [Actinotignum timonense]|nr:hypothetical protein [Actinotignum timonense]